MVDLTEPRHTLQEVAALCGVDLSTVWRWCIKGVDGRVLPSFLIGKRRHVLKRELDAFVVEKSRAAENPRPRTAGKRASRARDRAASIVDG